MTGFSLLRPQHEVDDALSERWLAKDGEHYKHVRTLALKAGLDEAEAGLLQDAYAACYPDFGVFISRPGQVDGFRRVVKFDPGWAGNGVEEKRTAVLAVDDTGRLHGRVLALPAHAARRENPSVLDVLRDGEPWGGSLGEPSVLDDFNRFAKGYKTHPLAVAKNFYIRMKQDAGVQGQLPAALSNPLKGLMRRWVTTNHWLAAWSIFEAIDPDVRRQMRSTHATTLSHAFWFSGTDRPCSPDEAVRLGRNRLQASQVYPFMTHYLKRNDFQGAIDAGAPLAPLIEAEFGLTRQEARVLQGLTWQKLGLGIRPSFGEISIAASIGSRLGGVSRKNNSNMHSVWRAALRFRVDTGEYLDKIASAFAKSADEGWERERKLQEAADLADYLSTKLYVPAALNGLRARIISSVDRAPAAGARKVYMETGPDTREVKEKSPREFFRALGAKDLLAASDRWHRSLPAHDMRLSTLDTGARWAPFLGAYETPGGVSCRELASSDALSTQGRAEGHCVGGYDRNVLSSTERHMTVIFSLEKGNDIIGTLEIAGRRQPVGEEDDLRFAFRSVQLRGRANTGVSPEAQAAADALIGHIGKMPVEDCEAYLNGLKGARDKRQGQAHLSPALADARYNFWDRAELEKAWSDLSVYLPRSMRKAGLDSFIEHCTTMMLKDGKVEMNTYVPSAFAEIVRPEGGMCQGHDELGRPCILDIRPFWELQEAQVRAVRGGAPIPDTTGWRELMDIRAGQPDEAPTEVACVERCDDDYEEVPF